MNAYQVLLYYLYTPIENPDAFREEHHQFCLDHDILGRIIIAEEGINGTISGRIADCQAYMQAMKADPRFAQIDFKVDSVPAHTFQKLYVRVKPEIVHSGLNHIQPQKKTGTHLEPHEFKKLKDDEDVLILDVRSNYEHKVGKFKNAHTLDMENFREFPEKIQELEKFRDKKIITYCTGGIKCEKASAFLLEKGFEEVYQLHGGIIKYGLEAQGEDFEGKCYVFDKRILVDVNSANPSVIAQCKICGTQSDRMVNCANPECNEHFPMCEDCGDTLAGACSQECKEHPNKRPYDGSGFYEKNLNGYDPKMNSLNKNRKAF